MLKGLMMDRPLLVSSIIDFAAEVHAGVPIISASVEGGIHRTTVEQSRRRIARLANALVTLGIKPGDRVATLAWNTWRHVELYYAISGIGAVCHTLNPRLYPEQLAYIVKHAQDRALFFDLTFAPLIEKHKQAFEPVQMRVAMTASTHMPAAALAGDALCFEDLLAGQPETIAWPDLDENTACALCYTSGTTGEPKGALFSHRSTVLHALFTLASLQQPFGITKPLLPVVPLFHVNAWGLPYACLISGTPLVLPGAKLDGASLFDLMETGNVYSAWGVPTVWLGLLVEMEKRGRKPANLSQVIIGGSAAPPPMIEAFERRWGVDVVHGWGMTEMSPVGAFTRLSAEMQDAPFAERLAIKSRQGRRIFGVEMKIVDADGCRLPHDGRTTGELYVRGPAVISAYFDNAQATRQAFDGEGWFATGDVAKITSDGFLMIVDRTKDLVKSGGEWISSIDIENIAIGCPGIANAAVIAVTHSRWGERPLLVVVKAAGADPTREAILAHLTARLAKWQVPDDVVFVDQLPMTATGKISKRELRALFADYVLPEAERS